MRKAADWSNYVMQCTICNAYLCIPFGFYIFSRHINLYFIWIPGCEILGSMLAMYTMLVEFQENTSSI